MYWYEEVKLIKGLVINNTQKISQAGLKCFTDLIWAA
jgi:hypothetical protein